MMWGAANIVRELRRERENRTLARLLVGPVSGREVTVAKWVTALLVGAAQLLLLVNSLWTGIDHGDSPTALVLVMALIVVMSSAAGLLLGTLEITPEFMPEFGRALPTGQAITVYHDLIGRGHGVAEVAPMLWGLGFWAVLLLVLAALRFRRYSV